MLSPGRRRVLQSRADAMESLLGSTASDCRPGNVLNALKVARQLGTYLITKILLEIFATLPVPTATVFNALKLIKTYLRTSMQKNRLDALALLYINNDIKLDYSQVIDQFAKGNRRLNLK